METTLTAVRPLSYKIAKTVSYIFIPPMVIMFTYLYLVMGLELMEPELLFIPAVFGLLGPVAMFIYLRKKGMVSDNEAMLKEERLFPYTLGVVILILGAALFFIYNVTGPAFSIWVSYLICCILIIPITKFWKISAHSMGVGIPGALLAVYNPLLFVALSAVSGMVFWSRYTLKCHTITQIAAGYSLGFAVSFIMLSF